MPRTPPAHPAFQMDHLSLVHRVWVVRIRVPKPLVPIMGRSLLSKTTGHRDPIEAFLASKPIIAAFKAQIAAARGMSQAAPMRPPGMVKGTATSGLSRFAIRITGLIAPKVPDPEPSHALVADWEAHLAAEGTKPQQVAMLVVDVGLIPKHDLRAAPWTPTTAEARVALRLAGGDAAATVQRRLSNLRSYGRYLKAQTGHTALLDALMATRVPKASKSAKAKQVRRKAFTWPQVAALWQATDTSLRGGKPDQALRDLVSLAAFTGARIEELCQATVANVDLKADVPMISVCSKTEAGRRDIPLVPRAVELVSRLVTAAPKDGQWLIVSDSVNQHGIRSVGPGKRFGRLKTAQGHGPDLVFHSIRKALATALQNAGCPEPTAADIREMGLLYDSSLMADDDHYELTDDGEATGIVELPPEWIRDDAPYFGFQRHNAIRPHTSSSGVEEICRAEFDGAHDEGGLYMLTMHLHIICHRSRIALPDRLIAHMRTHKVWFATHEQVAKWSWERAPA